MPNLKYIMNKIMECVPNFSERGDKKVKKTVNF